MDAQQELAFCLANGRGCKKDRKEAAHWYREAVRYIYPLSYDVYTTDEDIGQAGRE